MTKRVLTIAGALVAVAVIALVPTWTEPAVGTPMYAQRSGRTCANCHVSPTLESEEGWDNPELGDRKCTMSCIACHTNPTGGGLRNASGRYYGQSTLGIYHSQDRSYSDLQREIIGNDALWRYGQKVGRPVLTEEEGGRSIPTDLAEFQQGIGGGQRGNWRAFGEPLGERSKYAFWDGRYDDLKADPLIQFGLDARMAFWSGTNSPFPMQVDLHSSIHPVEHITLMGTAALRGRSSGVVALFENPKAPVYARTAFLMVHELPGMSWGKVGRFLPAFGVHVDDHTSFTRSLFEMNMADSTDLVHGVELGTAPNYPWATASVFTNRIGDGSDQGWGATAAGGWRDLGWSLGAHAMMKQRGGQGDGDLLAAGIQWGFNPIYYNNAIPLTLVGEIDYGQRTLGDTTRFVASTTEMWWLWKNGLNLRVKHDWAQVDLDVRGDWQSRYALGLEVAPIPGLTFTAWGRALHASRGTLAPDLFLTTHVWF